MFYENTLFFLLKKNRIFYIIKHVFIFFCLSSFEELKSILKIIIKRSNLISTRNQRSIFKLKKFKRILCQNSFIQLPISNLPCLLFLNFYEVQNDPT